MSKPSTFTLIVKGQRDTALAEAITRGITASVLHELEPIPGYHETILMVVGPPAPLHDWLTEDAPNSPPYPNGSLLCFTDHEEWA